ncbi:MAG: bifunctional DNA-formamidopyrimidine glycosylase/DNA-(apurinic or apyrimidinic site) lyase [Pseudomonadota bacterium]|nr:bifunctional DNA-formamidopyrimidine glycosylase/DNA-(apurinic or apyrimidinic site) lyase [Pseudomonadota bacterium]
MPELPEVECLAQALRKKIIGAKVQGIKFWRRDLREPLPQAAMRAAVCGKRLEQVERRAKYLLLTTGSGSGLLVHLGMSGNLFLTSQAQPCAPHAHVCIELETHAGKKNYLQYVDPRRFGRMAAFQPPATEHAFLRKLGVEPLQQTRLAHYLWRKSRGKRQAIKNYLMDNQVVVGIGNIYACEALYAARLHPLLPAMAVSLVSFQRLARSCRTVLKRAIAAGGTSFRDYRHLEGGQGYFAVSLAVYSKQGQPCPTCNTPIAVCRIAGRSTFYCPSCQVL